LLLFSTTLDSLDLNLGDLAFLIEGEVGGHAPGNEEDGDASLDHNLVTLKNGVLPLAGGLDSLKILGKSLFPLVSPIPIEERRVGFLPPPSPFGEYLELMRVTSSETRPRRVCLSSASLAFMY